VAASVVVLERCSSASEESFDLDLFYYHKPVYFLLTSPAHREGCEAQV
jgi:hypothetical protein